MKFTYVFLVAVCLHSVLALPSTGLKRKRSDESVNPTPIDTGHWETPTEPHYSFRLSHLEYSGNNKEDGSGVHYKLNHGTGVKTSFEIYPDGTISPVHVH